MEEKEEEHENSSLANANKTLAADVLQKSSEFVSSKVTLVADVVADQKNLEALPTVEDDGESVGATKMRDLEGTSKD